MAIKAWWGWKLNILVLPMVDIDIQLLESLPHEALKSHWKCYRQSLLLAEGWHVKWNVLPSPGSGMKS